MALFKPVQTTGSNLPNASVVDGQFVVTTDRGEAYIDTSSGRIRIADVITGTYSSITSNLAPLLNKLYFATDTHQLLQAVSNNNTLSWVQVGEPTYLTSLMTNSNSGKYITFASDGSLVATAFPVASTLVVGGVSVDGTSITVTNAGVISAADQLSSVKTSGNSGKYLTINSSGAVTATAFPAASTSKVGGVKVDGTVLSVDSYDVLKINKNALVVGNATNSITIGTETENYSSGVSSIAIGDTASARKLRDIAIGYGAYANASHGVAIGPVAEALDEGAVAIGSSATAGRYAVQLGNGTASANTFGVDSFQLLDLTNGKIPAARLPVATANAVGGVKVDGTSITISNDIISATDVLESVKTEANSGKYLTINSSGEVVATSLPIYNGEVV